MKNGELLHWKWSGRCGTPVIKYCIFQRQSPFRMMKDYVNTNNQPMIQKLIKVLAQDLTLSDNANYRKGGLIALAAASIALGKQIRGYMPQIIKPVLACFNDADSRIRYFACEALYNVVKVARDSAMPYFSEIFDVLSKVILHCARGSVNAAEPSVWPYGPKPWGYQRVGGGYGGLLAKLFLDLNSL